jgi:predicted deacylase
MPATETFFPVSYHDARGRFVQALDAFEARTGQRFVRERAVVDTEQDLSIDVAQLRAAQPQRLYVAVSGIHGIEGYAGHAIQATLLEHVLPRLDPQTTGVLLVHALNPTGMHHMRRVNGRNVDLNRNFAPATSTGSELYASDSSGYMWLASALGPTQPYDGRLRTRAGLIAELALAVGRHGFETLRQATLAGQYAAPRGVFYGGAEPELETRIFARVFEQASHGYAEILLTDLHTGYGERGQAYSLFARADSPEVKELTDQGVRDARGRNKSYSARGDLVGYCYETAKRHDSTTLCNSVVVELGTHGLGTLAQVQDLQTVVRENQIHLHGAKTPEVKANAERAFRELFNPSDPDWQRQAVAAGLERIESLLTRRGFLPGH